jgi:aryl-alcohol dehydrogenase-like predicted oxidoreductase
MRGMAHVISSLARTSLLGTSGLRVTPLCLGTMTFGTEWGWGIAEDVAMQLLDRYAEAGGNFIDTADLYTQGTSERIVGKWIKERGARHRVVLASKFTFQMGKETPPNANSGGNGRKNILRAVDASLARLQTDFLDLLWLHCWDQVTPVNEVLSTLDDLVRAGKVRAVGLSDVPAWYASRMVTMAAERGLERPCALQLEYSLLERNIEREHVPLARELGLGITPWGPLAIGMLTGKHSRGTGGAKVDGQGRLKTVENSPAPTHVKLYTEKNWQTVDLVKELAAQLQKTPAQVALNFITKRPGVQSTILGATKLEQLEGNLHALEFDLPADARKRLEDATRLESLHPYSFFDGPNKAITGGAVVEKKPAWY